MIQTGARDPLHLWSGLSVHVADEPAARSCDHCRTRTLRRHADHPCRPGGSRAYFHPVMHRLLILPLLLLSIRAAAQVPTPCALVVPNTVTPNSEAAVQATCPCRVTTFEAKVFNRWAGEVWSTKQLQGFPNDLLGMEGVGAGTYLWQAEYTAIVDGIPLTQKANGYLQVLR